MNEILLGYYNSYEVTYKNFVSKVELFGLDVKKSANYKVSIIGNVLYIFQNLDDNEYFVERALTNFDVEFMGD